MTPLQLCPPPRECTSRGGVFSSPLRTCRIPESWRSDLSGAISELTGFELVPAGADFEVTSDTTLPPEGYRLEIGDVIGIAAADAAGARHALITLAAIRDQSPDGHLPQLSILDHPDFPVRGFMLDISRCKVPTMESLKRMAQHLARLKYNQLQLYTEHTFRFSEHECVWRDASPMTSEEVRELDAHCSALGIELVPNLNSFGHMERWLRHSEYHHLAECPDGFETRWSGRSPWGATLKPDEASLEFMSRLYDEFLPCFSSGLFNVGCDETWELGQGASAERCGESGTTRVYLEYLKSIHERVSARGRRMMFWGDIILHEPELIPELPQDVIAMNWGYEANHPFDSETSAFSEAGIPFYVCPGTSSWRALIGRTGNMLSNVRNAAVNGLTQGASGFLLTDWGDEGHHQYWPFSWPGIVAAACCAWHLDGFMEESVGSMIDHVFDIPGGTGELLMDCGRCCELTGAAPANSNLFHHLLFGKGVPDAYRETVSIATLNATHDDLSSLMVRAEAIEGMTGEEIRNGLHMAMCAVSLGLAGFGAPPDGFNDVNARESLALEHERLWRLRNRSGGLAESLSALRSA